MGHEEKEEHFRKARNIVFRLLKFRLRSKKELDERLKARNLPVAVIKQTLQYFKDLSLIDDREFARQWISSRLKKPFGINRIRIELKKKGIDEAIIDETLKEAAKEYDESAVVAQLARLRALKYKDADPQKVQQRVYGYLLRRGFDMSVIIKAIKNI